MAKKAPKPAAKPATDPVHDSTRNLCYVVASLMPHLGAVNAGPLASAALLVDIDANCPYPLMPHERKEWDDAARALDNFLRQVLSDVIVGKGVGFTPEAIRERSRVEVFVTLMEKC